MCRHHTNYSLTPRTIQSERNVSDQLYEKQLYRDQENSLHHLLKKFKLLFIAVVHYFEHLQLQEVDNSEVAIDILSNRHLSLNILQLFN
jgi:hypothetical protein